VTCLVCKRLSADETPAQPRVGDLTIVPLDMHITKMNGRYTSQPGFHYVRFTVSVKNVGQDAVCTLLSATLESTLKVGKRRGSWELKPRNGAATASGGFIHQLLPGEELEGRIIFGDLRDGVKPVTLTIESQRQTCDANEGSESSPLTFAIRDSAGRVKISLLTNNRAVQSASAIGSSPEPQQEPTKPRVLISAPKALYAPDAEYTQVARQAKLSGSVKLRVLVGKDGVVYDAVFLRRLGMGLDEKAIAAVRQWRFTPAMADGKPVDLWINVDIDFRLY